MTIGHIDARRAAGNGWRIVDIELLHSRAPRLLLVRYKIGISAENIDRLNAFLARYVGEYGATDTIIDFTIAPLIGDMAMLLTERGRQPTRLHGFRRAFIVRENQLPGFRHYNTQQEKHGDDPPLLVRSIEEALARLEAAGASFQTVAFSSGAPHRP